MKKINTVQPGEVVTARYTIPSPLPFEKHFFLMDPGVPTIQLVSTMKPTLEALPGMRCAISTLCTLQVYFALDFTYWLRQEVFT